MSYLYGANKLTTDYGTIHSGSLIIKLSTSSTEAFHLYSLPCKACRQHGNAPSIMNWETPGRVNADKFC